MVDAYVSCLEQRPILLWAFNQMPLTPGDFDQLLFSSWNVKLSTVTRLAATASGWELLERSRCLNLSALLLHFPIENA